MLSHEFNFTAIPFECAVFLRLQAHLDYVTSSDIRRMAKIPTQHILHRTPSQESPVLILS